MSASPARMAARAARSIASPAAPRSGSPVSSALSSLDDEPVAPPKKRKGKAIKTEEDAPAKKPRQTKGKAVKTEDVAGDGDKPTKKPRKTKAKVEEGDDADEKPAKKPRKRKSILALADEVFPPRFHDGGKLVGAHVSASGGAHQAIPNALRIGGRAFGVFTKNQRQWASKPLDEDCLRLFPAYAKCDDGDGKTFGDGQGIDLAKAVVTHASYLINLAAPDAAEWDKSVASFIDEAKRCDQLGIGFLVFHPGSTKGQCTREESFASIARGINRAHAETERVTILVENMAHGTVNMTGNKFSDIAAILAQVTDRSRAGCCFDTCHAFAAGYDLRTPETYDATMTEFDETVGLNELKAVHCNDSKEKLGGHRDLHQNIGMGHLGLRAFALLMADKRLDGRPIILETPMLDGTLNPSGPGGGVWRNEIALLHRLEQLGGRGEPGELEADAEVARLFGEIKAAVEAEAKVKEAKKAEKKAAKAANGGTAVKKGKGKKAKTDEEEEPSDDDELDG